MSSESRRQATEDLCARIDQVVTGHEHQHAYFGRDVVISNEQPPIGRIEVEDDGNGIVMRVHRHPETELGAWERFCRAITSHWRD